MYENTSDTKSNSKIISELTKQLVSIRKQLAKFASTSVGSEVQARIIHEKMIGIKPNIEHYIECFNQTLIQESQQSLAQPNCRREYDSSQQIITINIYLWQILNFLCINLPEFPSEMISIVCPLLQLDVIYQYAHSLNSLKNAMIFINNWLAKYLREKNNSHYWPHIKKAITMLIAHQFEIGRQKMLSQKFLKSKKQESHRLAETEWLGYIIMQVFNKSQSLNRKDSLIRQLVQASKHPKILYFILHTIGNYLENMIEKRVTTELVAGLQCQIEDVREMYNKNTNNVTQISISIGDLQYIACQYKAVLLKYIQIVQIYLATKVQNKNLSPQLTIMWTDNADLLTQLQHLFNCILFIGGYNQRLQDIVVELLLQKDTYLLDHLQVSYLLYRNIESTRYNSKVNMISEMEAYAKNKLLSLMNIDQTCQDIKIKELQLEKVLIPGQLVSLLRMLTNLVHISHRGQSPFEKNSKYLHIIMSLTHDSVSQATMKEWAIMFIRNVSEWSQELRDEISKIKIEMKVS